MNFGNLSSTLLGITLLGVIGCGGGGGGVEPPPPPVENIPPAIVTTEKSATEGSDVEVTVTATDSDGTIASYAWTQKSGIEVELANAQTNTVSFVAPAVKEDSLVILTVTATDDDGASTSVDIPVTVNALPNIAPTIDSAEQAAVEGSDVEITVVAEDSDGAITSYIWTQKSGIEVELADVETNTVSFVAPAVTEESLIILTVTATDDEGASTSADIPVTVNSIVLDLTLQGKVTDGPIANAHVTASVGTQIFETAADQDGNYEIDLSVDDSFAQELVKIVAVGPETNSPVKLTSLVGQFEALQEAAGEDKVLTKGESFAVNVTNLSTAIDALMRRANGGQEILTSEASAQAAKSFESALSVPFATAIKLVIDYSAENDALLPPTNISDTAALVADYDAVRGYINTAQIQFSTLYEEAQAALLNDPEVVSSGVDDSIIPIADTYYFVTSDGFNGEGRLVLNADGSGSMIEHDGEIEINWNGGGDGIELTYSDGPIIESTTFEYVEAADAVIEVQVINTGKTAKWLYQTETADQLMIIETTYRHFPNFEVPDEAPVNSERSLLAIKTAGVLDAADILQVGLSYVFPIAQVADEYIGTKSDGSIFGEARYFRDSVKMEFSGSITEGGTVMVSKHVLYGNGSKTLDQRMMQWQIAVNGHLEITGDESYDYVFLIENEGKTPYVNVMVQEGDKRFASSDNALLKEVSPWTAESAVGIYDLPWDFFAPLSYFWVEVNADGTALTVSTNDWDQSGSLESNEVTQMPGLWQINAQGNIVVRRYRQNSLLGLYGYCTPANWDPADDEECLLYHEREWDLHQVTESDEYYMDHMHRFFDDSFREWVTTPEVEGHILGRATSDIRSWNKVDSRPIALPEAQMVNTKSTKFRKKVELESFKTQLVID